MKPSISLFICGTLLGACSTATGPLSHGNHPESSETDDLDTADSGADDSDTDTDSIDSADTDTGVTDRGLCAERSDWCPQSRADSLCVCQADASFFLDEGEGGRPQDIGVGSILFGFGQALILGSQPAADAHSELLAFPSDERLTGNLLTSDALSTVVGGAGYWELGRSVACGDLDGDGQDDVLSSLTTLDPAEAYLVGIPGPLDTVSQEIVQDQLLIHYQSTVYSEFPRNAPVLADLDDDGLSDLYVYGHYDAFVVPGPVSGPLLNLPDDSRTTFHVESREGSIWSSSAPRDLDGDGVVDIALFDESGIFVLLGPLRDRKTMSDADILIAVAGATTQSLEPIQVADVTDDGYPDLTANCITCSDYSGVAFTLPGPLRGNYTVGDAIATWQGSYPTDPICGIGAARILQERASDILVQDCTRVGVFSRPSGALGIDDADVIIDGLPYGALEGQIRTPDLDEDATGDVLISGYQDGTAVWWLFYGARLAGG